MDKNYHSNHYINNDPDIEYNHSNSNEEEISRETMKLLLTFYHWLLLLQ